MSNMNDCFFVLYVMPNGSSLYYSGQSDKFLFSLLVTYLKKLQRVIFCCLDLS